MVLEIIGNDVRHRSLEVTRPRERMRMREEVEKPNLSLQLTRLRERMRKQAEVEVKLRRELASCTQELAAYKRGCTCANQPSTIPPPSLPSEDDSTPRSAPRSLPRYAQPTRSSRCKDKTPEPVEPVEPVEPPRVVTVHDRDYVYKSGIPLPATPKPVKEAKHFHFFSSTVASQCRGYSEKWIYRPMRPPPLRFASWRKPITPDTTETPETPLTPVTPVTPETSETPETPETEESPLEGSGSSRPSTPASSVQQTYLSPAEAAVERKLEILRANSRHEECLDEVETRQLIDPLFGFKTGKKAMRILQACLFEAFPQYFAEEQYPQLIPLGYGELNTRLPNLRYGSDQLERNGVSGYVISSSIYNATYLRNSLCHPRVSSWSDASLVEWYLADAQNTVILIGDAERAMQLRALRDELRDHVKSLLDTARDLYILTLLPFAGTMEVDAKIGGLFVSRLRNHIRYLTVPDSLDSLDKLDIRERMFLEVARAWVMLNDR